MQSPGSGRRSIPRGHGAIPSPEEGAVAEIARRRYHKLHPPADDPGPGVRRGTDELDLPAQQRLTKPLMTWPSRTHERRKNRNDGFCGGGEALPGRQAEEDGGGAVVAAHITTTAMVMGWSGGEERGELTVMVEG